MMTVLKHIAKRIYKQLKVGHTEKIYHRAFEIELRNNNIPYETEKEIIYNYNCSKGKNYTLGMGKIDILIKNDIHPIIVELKATPDNDIKQNHKEQLHKYMRNSGIKNIRGLIINFKQAKNTKKNDEYNILTYECKLNDDISI